MLGTSLARPLIAKRQMEIAKIEDADAVSHGATGKGNDQVRFELTYFAIDPNIKIIAPWREWDLNSRSALIDFAKAHGIPVQATKKKPYSTDRNLLHISYEGGILEDPWNAPPEDMFVLTASPKNAPDDPEVVEITFKEGNPVAVNDQCLSPAGLLAELNKIGGRHGIGRCDLVENRFVGMKSRGVYETPGGTILRSAHMALESITLDREVMHLRDSLIPRYAEMVYYGFWFSPERELMQNMIDETQKNVTGVVRLEFIRAIAGFSGGNPIIRFIMWILRHLKTDSVYRQHDAEGFIRLNALRLRIGKLLKDRLDR